MTGSAEAYVLDTSAILALWNEEDGSAFVEKILRDKFSSHMIYVSFMTVMECRYLTWKRLGRDASNELIRGLELLPFARVDIDDTLIATAAELKAQHKISVADSWIAATAITRNAMLVHKDPEFETLSGQVAMKPLPYKKRNPRL